MNPLLCSNISFQVREEEEEKEKEEEEEEEDDDEEEEEEEEDDKEEEEDDIHIVCIQMHLYVYKILQNLHPRVTLRCGKGGGGGWGEAGKARGGGGSEDTLQNKKRTTQISVCLVGGTLNASGRGEVEEGMTGGGGRGAGGGEEKGEKRG
jgi:hypothetical protein